MYWFQQTLQSKGVIHEDDVVASLTAKSTVVVAGMPGDLSFGFLLDDARPLETVPQIRFLNVAFNTEALDIYILEPGTPIDDDAIALIRGLPPAVDTGFNVFSEGLFELTVTLADETTPISTPVTLDLATEDVIDVIVVDTVDPTLVELLVFDTHPTP